MTKKCEVYKKTKKLLKLKIGKEQSRLFLVHKSLLGAVCALSGLVVVCPKPSLSGILILFVNRFLASFFTKIATKLKKKRHDLTKARNLCGNLSLVL